MNRKPFEGSRMQRREKVIQEILDKKITFKNLYLYPGEVRRLKRKYSHQLKFEKVSQGPNASGDYTYLVSLLED